jgi:hypothetical protein
VSLSATRRAEHPRHWTVYLMSDPRPLGLAYVGCTVSPLKKRLGEHINDPFAHRVRIWVEVLRRENIAPQIDSLYVVDDKQTGLALESSTIRSFAQAGVALLNTAHARPANAPTLAHVRLWSLCQNKYKALSKRLHGAIIPGQRPLGLIRQMATGYCPALSDAIRLEERLSIPLRDWLSDAEPLSRAA